MATLWQGLGSQVTVLARRALLPRLEPFAGELVARGLTDAGARVRIGVQVTALRRPNPAGPVTCTLDDGSELETDEIMFATGRAPLTDDIGLDTVGLTRDPGWTPTPPAWSARSRASGSTRSATSTTAPS